MPIEIPDPQYARTDDGAYIAYQVVGDGPVDIAWQFDFFGNLDTVWDGSYDSVWFEGLASFARLILHDRRATGLSSRNVPVPNLETRAADLRAVLDAAHSEHAVCGAWLESLAPCVLLAATDPKRVRALLWDDPLPRITKSSAFPWGLDEHTVASERALLAHWGTIEYARGWADLIARTTGVRPPDDEIRHVARQSRNTCTPDVAVELTEIWWETDIANVLPTVQTPTLLMILEGDSLQAKMGRHVASLMPSAEVTTWADEDWPIGKSGLERQVRPRLDAIQRFIGVEPTRPALETVLATVLFTDIVDSTRKQAALGDRDWKLLVEHHHEVVRSALGHWRGTENDTAGDGFYATFDGPARAIHCALEVGEQVRGLGIQIRAGVHTGECEVIDGKAGGIAVSIGARVGALAGASEVLVSQTVKDLVAGSGFTFDARGEHQLKGVPGAWGIYAVTSDRSA